MDALGQMRTFSLDNVQKIQCNCLMTPDWLDVSCECSHWSACALNFRDVAAMQRLGKEEVENARAAS